MKYVLDSHEMKDADNNTIGHFGVDSLVLMERAALQVAEVLKEAGLLQKRIAILCGMGNNGGDGFALGRILFLRHCSVCLFPVGDKDKMTKETAAQYDICQKYGVPMAFDTNRLPDYDVYVDALFGIGLTRELSGIYYDLVAKLNELPGYKVALDMPSGVSADDGSVLGIGFLADITVTFAFPKIGQLIFPGKNYAGRLFVREIGITQESLLMYQPRCRMLEQQDLAFLPPVPLDAHKGSRGKVLCIAGSQKMGGAACLVGKATMDAGAGMVQIYTPSCNRDLILASFPEALVSCYDKKPEEEKLLKLMSWADVIAIGPGLGTTAEAESLVSFVLRNASVPLVLDADALNIISLHMDWLKSSHAERIVTPHLGEMSRLTGNPLAFVQSKKLSLCCEFARDYQVICVLKDAATITAISYGNVFINTTGNGGMASAGSGDVLTGIIAGLIAQGLAGDKAAPVGVYLHGLAGDYAMKKHSLRGMTASDLLEGLQTVYLERGL